MKLRWQKINDGGDRSDSGGLGFWGCCGSSDGGARYYGLNRMVARHKQLLFMARSGVERTPISKIEAT